MESPRRLRHGQSSSTCECLCRRWPVLQRLCHVNSFMIVFSGIYIISLSVAGYLAGVLSTLEKRFQLRSAEVGAITTVSSGVSLSLVVFLSYYGQNKHRPRWIAVGALFVGVGTILMSFPQLVYDTPPFLLSNAPVTNTTNIEGVQSTKLCQQTENGANFDYNNSCDGEQTTSTSSYGVGWLITGQVLIGIGSSPFLPLAITFIDDNVPKTSTALYVGILFASSGIAPLFGFGLSSVCLSYYSDYYKSNAPDISQDDPNWLGAWWLGFLIYGITTLILSVPMFMFPKRISEHQDHDETKDVEEVANGRPSDNVADMLDLTSVVYRPISIPNPDAETVKCGVVKGFLVALGRILTNPAFVIVVFGVCVVFAAMSGFLTFGAKYIETQYGVSPSLSPLILGGMVAPGGILGNFLGGYIVKRFRLNALQCARMILLIALPMTVISPCLYFFGCDNPAIAGLTVDYISVANTDMMYGNMTYNEATSLSSISQCNAHCQCETVYSPVCGSNGVTYVSPCYAGCTETAMDDDNNTIFQSCGCISETDESVEGADVPLLEGEAQKGECNRECDTLWVFAGVFMVVFLFSCIWSNPAFMLYLRVVDPRDRAIAVGFASLALKALGFIPAPIFYGKAIQSTCILSWQLSCDEIGACIVYDLPLFRAKFLGLSYGLQVLVSFCMCVAYFAVKRQTAEGFQQRLGDVRIERRPTVAPVGDSDTSSLQTSHLTSEDIANGNGHPHEARTYKQ